MNVLLLTSHSIAEYDDLRMLTDLGYDVFSIGAYTHPSRPTDDKRPALPDVPFYADLADRCEEQRRTLGDPGPRIDWAKAALHPDIIDWADAIIVHHFPEWWIARQWEAITHKRVIWRTCGQSGPDGSLERLMSPLRAEGLEIVRYSPRERNLRDYAGEDALIRFGKYPDDYGPWVGDNLAIGNVTQNMAQRGDACGFRLWEVMTEGFPTMPAGPGSEALRGGIGPLAYVGLLDYLRHLRLYLYTGTTPASYTLGLIEAMLSGVPTVSIGPAYWAAPSELYEGDQIAGRSLSPDARRSLGDYLRDDDMAAAASMDARQRALDLFDVAVVGPQWKAFLG